MSWKLMAMLPPQWGIGLELKISRLFSRKSRIQAGSFFISEICRTMSASKPRRALKTYFDSVRKSYLLISPIIGSACVVVSVAINSSCLSKSGRLRGVGRACGLTVPTFATR